MTRPLPALALVFLSAIVVPAQSQSMRPGLWEIDNKVGAKDSQMGRQMAQLQKQLAAMPPEQRKMMEDMMARHAGAAMSGVSADGVKVTMCMSRDMVERNELPMQQTGNCTHQRLPQVGDTIQMRFTCTEPPASGEGTVHLDGDRAYTMDLRMTSSVKGKPETTTMHSAGRWLGADCGNLKPPPLPPRKN
ncbi:Protein of unknown function [Massilia sp. CF038]|nr:Protein of unknown function [Massilia sp. CF038]